MNVLGPTLRPDDVTIPPNEHTVITIQSQIYAESAVTGMLQPSDLSHEEGDVTFCAAIATLNEGTMGIHVNNFTDQSYKLKKGLQIVNVSVMTSEQMKHVRPTDPVFTCHLLNEMKRTPSTSLAVFSKRTETKTKMNNIDSRHQKVQDTRTLKRQDKT